MIFSKFEDRILSSYIFYTTYLFYIIKYNTEKRIRGETLILENQLGFVPGISYKRVFYTMTNISRTYTYKQFVDISVFFKFNFSSILVRLKFKKNT